MANESEPNDLPDLYFCPYLRRRTASSVSGPPASSRTSVPLARGGAALRAGGKGGTGAVVGWPLAALLPAVLPLRMPRPRRPRATAKRRQRVAVAAAEAAAAVVLRGAVVVPAEAAAPVTAAAGRRSHVGREGLHSLRGGQS